MPRNPAAQTAFGPIVLSAVEQQEPPDRRLVDDDLAASFLPKPLRALVRATRCDAVRRMVIAASERSGPGLWANLACRKSYIDDNLAESLPDVAAVVILGSGLDTRPYRLARHSDVPVFEVDLPVNIARKRAVVARVFGIAPSSVRLVSVDFERDDLMATLASDGYRPDSPAFFVWEGVTQYLTPEAVAATFDQLAQAAAGAGSTSPTSVGISSKAPDCTAPRPCTGGCGSAVSCGSSGCCPRTSRGSSTSTGGG